MLTLQRGLVLSDFGDWLKEQRQRRRLTQDELAELTGYTKSHISSIERDAPHTATGKKVKPSPDFVERLAEAFRLDVLEVWAHYYGRAERPELIGASDDFREGLTDDQAQAVQAIADQLRRANEGR